jgi:hypothetical protein
MVFGPHISPFFFVKISFQHVIFFKVEALTNFAAIARNVRVIIGSYRNVIGLLCGKH